MSGPFGNPAMVSSGGGGANAPFLFGALEFGTKGTNPNRGSSYPNRALGLIDQRPWFNSLSSPYLSIYPYKWTYSFWIKGYVSNNWFGGTNFPPSNEYNSGNAFILMRQDAGSRDHIATSDQLYSGYAGVFDPATHSNYIGFGKSRAYSYALGIPNSTGSYSVSNGEMTNWAHIVVTFDWQAGQTSGNTNDAMRMWFNGVPCPSYSGNGYYGGISFEREPPNPWGYSRFNYGDYFTNLSTWNWSTGHLPNWIQGWFGDYGYTPAFGCGYHGLLANFQIFPWGVDASELGYDNGGVWSAKQYAPSGVANPYRQQHEFHSEYYDGGTATYLYNQIGELWASSYDFADPVNWHLDSSGNGMHFFRNGDLGSSYQPHGNNYFNQVTHDLPPQ